jgi:hypothetical protein
LRGSMTAENVPLYLNALSALIERRYRIPFRLKAISTAIRCVGTGMRLFPVENALAPKGATAKLPALLTLLLP